MWYYRDGESEVGPVDIDELKRLIREKKINGRTLVRNAKGTRWKPLAERVKKKPQQPVEPQNEPAAPVPPPEVNETPAQPPELTLERSKSEGAEPEEKAETTPPPSDFARRHTLPFSFTGTGSEYFKIWIVNVVLSIVTCGIYSAWAKVRRKQYFYGNTRVNDASFTYLANPVTILKGRIIVFAGFMVYSMTNQFFPIASLAILLVMLPMLPWFIVRALAFNARNSATRNIRFTFNGTYMEAAKVYLLLPMLVPFTLGLIFPYIYYRQKKFLVENSGYGTTGFVFTAQSGDYYGIFLRLILPLLACIIFGVVADHFLPISSILLMAVFYFYAFAYVSVRSVNLLYNSSRLSKHGFYSTMDVTEYIGIVFTNTLATVFTAGLFHPFAQVRSYRYQVEHLSLMAVGDLDQIVADEKVQVSALGDEAAEFFDFDFGL